jgi:hypothetical protein
MASRLNIFLVVHYDTSMNMMIREFVVHEANALCLSVRPNASGERVTTSVLNAKYPII